MCLQRFFQPVVLQDAPATAQLHDVANKAAAVVGQEDLTAVLASTVEDAGERHTTMAEMIKETSVAVAEVEQEELSAVAKENRAAGEGGWWAGVTEWLRGVVTSAAGVWRDARAILGFVNTKFEVRWFQWSGFTFNVADC